MTPQELRSKIAAMKKELRELVAKESKPLVKGLFDEFFEKTPECKVVTWTQYTPYFNDGDPCTFSVHEMHFGTKDLDEDESSSLPKYPEGAEHGFETAWGLEYYAKKEGRAVDANVLAVRKKVESNGGDLESSLSGLSDVMESAFGDGVQVVVTRERGFEVREISHD
jgi:hypothetical protein